MGSHRRGMTDSSRAANTAAAATGGGPSAFLSGPAHLVMYGNAAFKAAYGASCVGQPARELMLDLPRPGFGLLDRVLVEGRALATRVRFPDGDRRLVAVPRRDPETGETYGVLLHLRPIAPERGRAV